MNATPVNAPSANSTKAVRGYDGPHTGPLTALRYAIEDPSLRLFGRIEPCLLFGSIGNFVLWISL